MRLVCAHCGHHGQQPFQDAAPFGNGVPRGLCVACAENAERPDEYRAPIKDFRPAETFDLLTSPRYIGIEFEMYHQRHNSDRSEQVCQDWRLLNCGAGEDGSISSDSGIEIKTPPAQGDDVALWINAVTTVAKHHGMRVNKSCGLHVHTDARDMKAAHLHSLIVLVGNIEPVLYALMPASRVSGAYSRPMGLDVRTSPTRRPTVQEHLRALLPHNEHYSALNVLHALEEHHTVEWRYHAGTLHPDKVLRWVQLVSALMDTARQGSVADFALPPEADFETRSALLQKVSGYPWLMDYLKKRMAFFGHQGANLIRDVMLSPTAPREHCTLVLSEREPLPPPDGGVQFRILQQHIPGGLDEWVASNGITLRVEGSPEWQAQERVLYLRGTDAHHDTDAVYCTAREFESILAAVREFNRTFGG